jgi:penicillin-binding protein 2
VKSDEVYKDTGSYTIEKCTIDCQRFNAQKVTWGPLDIKRAITVSSDVYFYRIGDKLGGQDAAQYGPLNAIQDTARSYGFGSPTGIALPNEPDGRVPDAKLKTALHKENPTAFPFGDWLTGDNVNLAVGQGLLVVTPLQLANAYGMFANGGQRYQPRIAKSVNAPGGQVHELGARKVGDPMVFTSDVRDSILTGMKGVVANREGTAVDAFSGFNFAKFDLAGKTGTAEVQSIDPNTKRRNADTSVFVGFGPVAAPKFVVSVVLEQSGFGSEAAAPAVRRIFDTLYGFAAPVLAPRVAEGDKMPDAPDLHILFPPEKNVLPD